MSILKLICVGLVQMTMHVLITLIFLIHRGGFYFLARRIVQWGSWRDPWETLACYFQILRFRKRRKKKANQKRWYFNWAFWWIELFLLLFSLNLIKILPKYFLLFTFYLLFGFTLIMSNSCSFKISPLLEIYVTGW